MQTQIRYWASGNKKLFQEFKESIRKKAEYFLRKGLVRPNGMYYYLVLPIPGYNSTPHEVFYNGHEYLCDCQGFKKNGFCSHVLAVMLYEERRSEA